MLTIVIVIPTIVIATPRIVVVTPRIVIVVPTIVSAYGDNRRRHADNRQNDGFNAKNASNNDFCHFSDGRWSKSDSLDGMGRNVAVRQDGRRQRPGQRRFGVDERRETGGNSLC